MRDKKQERMTNKNDLKTKKNETQIPQLKKNMSLIRVGLSLLNGSSSNTILPLPRRTIGGLRMRTLLFENANNYSLRVHVLYYIEFSSTR